MSSAYDRALERLTAIKAEREALAEEEYQLVKELREVGWRGLGWEQIATALGVSRQAAMKRFAQRLADENPKSWMHQRRWDAGRPRRSST